MSILWTFCEHSVHNTLKRKLWKNFRTKKKSENIWLITADSSVPSSNFEHINKWNLAQKREWEKCFSVMLVGCVSWTILPMGVHKFPTKQTNKQRKVYDGFCNCLYQSFKALHYVHDWGVWLLVKIHCTIKTCWNLNAKSKFLWEWLQ